MSQTKRYLDELRESGRDNDDDIDDEYLYNKWVNDHEVLKEQEEAEEQLRKELEEVKNNHNNKQEEDEDN